MTNVEQESDPSPNRSESFTKTHLMLAFIAIIGLAILYNVTRLPDGHPFKECERIIGMDERCKTDIAITNIMKGRP